MKASYYRVTIAVLIAVLLASAITDWIYDEWIEPFETLQIESRYQSLAENWVNRFRETSSQNWDGVLKDLSRSHDIDFRILSASELELVDSGVDAMEVIVQLDEIHIVISIDSQWVLEVGPLHRDAWLLILRPITVSIIFGLFCFTAVVIGLRPLRRDLLSTVESINQDDEGRHADTVNRLKQSVQQLSEINQSLSRTSETSIENQRDFLHAVAHEFRGPMARLRFAIAVDSDQRGETESPEAIIEDLDALVTEILEYSRYRHGQFEVVPEKFDIVKLLEDIVESNQALASEIVFTIQTVDDSERMVELDPKLVERVVSNLVSNAIRFARQRINLSVRFEANLLRLSVEDDGVGIPPGKRELVFEPFTRLDASRSRQTGGTGLGLSIVQGIMARVDGAVTLTDSVELSGASFNLSWPLSLNHEVV